MNEESYMTKMQKKDGTGKRGTEKGTKKGTRKGTKKGTKKGIVSRAVRIEGKIEQQ